MSHDQIPASDADQEEVNLLDILQVVADNLRLLVLGSLLIGVIALGATYLITPTYTGRVQFIPPKQQQSSAAAALSDLGILGGAAGAIAGVKNPADQYAALIKSKSVADALITQFDLTERYGKKLRDDTRKQLANNTRIFVGAKDGLITIEFDDNDAQIAADVANSYVIELRRLLNRVALTESQQRRVFFERMVSETKANLVKAEQALKTSGVDSAALKLSATTSLEGVARLRAQISVQEVKLAAMRGYLADTAPEFKLALNELMVLKNQMKSADKEDDATGGQSDYVARFREFKFQEALMGLYLKQFEVARVDESREGAVIQVVDAAEKPDRKSKPQKGQLAVMATLTGAVVLLMFVFVRHALRRTSDDPVTAEKLSKILRSIRRAIGLV